MSQTIPSTYAEARKLADEARDRATARKTEIRRSIERQARTGVRDFHMTPIKVIVDRYCSEDVIWKRAVADNQWYIQYATMYAQQELLNKLDELITLMRDR